MAPDPDWAESFLTVFAEERQVRAALEKIGVPKSTYYERKRRDEHFDAAVQEVNEQIVDELEDELVGIALKGGDSSRVRALEILLKARRSDVFSERVRLAHSGRIGRGDDIDFASLSEEELRALANGEEPERRGR